MPSVSIKNLLEAGVHFGHQTKKWNPKVKKYIFGQRNGIYIIDLQQTLMLFQQACEFAATLGQEGKHILFVGTKRQAQAAIREEAERSSNYFVNQRWLGGLLTNWETVKKSIETLKELDQICDGESAQTLTKKELSRLEKKRAKLTKVFAGIKEMRRPPEALFVIDPKKERIAIHEARRCGIKVISVVDTNCDPDGIDFVIPGNDDAIRAIRLFVSCIADSHMEGAQLSEAKRESGKDAQPEAAAESTAAGEEAAKEPPPKTITLTVPPGGQAPKPSGPSEMEPVPAEGSAKN